MTGRELRERRIAKRIQQKTLAAYAGISQAELSYFETERRKLNVDVVSRLVEGLGAIPLMRHQEVVELETTTA